MWNIIFIIVNYYYCCGTWFAKSSRTSCLMIKRYLLRFTRWRSITRFNIPLLCKSGNLVHHSRIFFIFVIYVFRLFDSRLFRWIIFCKFWEGNFSKFYCGCDGVAWRFMKAETCKSLSLSLFLSLSRFSISSTLRLSFSQRYTYDFLRILLHITCNEIDSMR